jgi:hypothetical protein
MESEGMTRSGRTFADWHHAKCATQFCERAYCREHQRLYWICQDFYEDRSVSWFGGDGECILCKSQTRIQRTREEWAFQTHAPI